jgi:hypothetical protein
MFELLVGWRILGFMYFPVWVLQWSGTLKRSGTLFISIWSFIVPQSVYRTVQALFNTDYRICNSRQRVANRHRVIHEYTYICI